MFRVRFNIFQSWHDINPSVPGKHASGVARQVMPGLLRGSCELLRVCCVCAEPLPGPGRGDSGAPTHATTGAWKRCASPGWQPAALERATRNAFSRLREDEDCPAAGMLREPGTKKRDLVAGETSVKSEIVLPVWKSGKRLQSAPAAVEGCAAGRRGSTWVRGFPAGKSLVVAKSCVNPT